MYEYIASIAQLLLWLVTAVGVLFGIFRGIREMRLTRETRQLEYRWRKADLARRVISDLESSESVKSALRLTDYDQNDIRISDDLIARPVDIAAALSVKPLAPGSKEDTIRILFHDLFGHLEQLEHLISIDLIEFKDVEYPLTYWMRNFLANWPAYHANLRAYRFPLAENFILRFDYDGVARRNL